MKRCQLHTQFTLNKYKSWILLINSFYLNLLFPLGQPYHLIKYLLLNIISVATVINVGITTTSDHCTRDLVSTNLLYSNWLLFL